MPRKKKTEEVQVTCFDAEADNKARLKETPIDFGTGWTGKNNKIQHELYEVKKNE